MPPRRPTRAHAEAGITSKPCPNHRCDHSEWVHDRDNPARPCSRTGCPCGHPKPATFEDLPAAKFPVHTQFEDSKTGKVLFEDTMRGPGALEIPPLAGKCSPGAMARVRITYGDGSTVVYPPDGQVCGCQGEPGCVHW